MVIELIKQKRNIESLEKKLSLQVGMTVKVNHPKLMGRELEVVKINRTTPKWNYEFITNYFKSTDTSSNPDRTHYDIKKIDLKSAHLVIDRFIVDPLSEENNTGFDMYHKDTIEVDKSSSYYFESMDNEKYIRAKLVKERVYDI